MKRARHNDAVHRGISLGTIVMVAVTVTVVGMTAVILPRLLGKTDFRMHVSGMLAALHLDETLPVLSLSEIPISEPTPTAEPVN